MTDHESHTDGGEGALVEAFLSTTARVLQTIPEATPNDALTAFMAGTSRATADVPGVEAVRPISPAVLPPTRSGSSRYALLAAIAAAIIALLGTYVALRGGAGGDSEGGISVAEHGGDEADAPPTGSGEPADPSKPAPVDPDNSATAPDGSQTDASAPADQASSEEADATAADDAAATGDGGDTEPGSGVDQSQLPGIDPSTLMVPNPGSNQPGQILNINSSSTDETLRVRCLPSHMASIDPMVAPGDPNLWHVNTFFGNTAIDENTNLDALTSTGSSTCGGGILNRSAYWVPTMVDDRTGAAIEPLHLLIYYHSAYRSGPFTGLPSGLRMLTGDALSTSPQQTGVSFRCQRPGSNDTNGDFVVDCEPGNELWQIVTFPTCWDGQSLDSANHRDHLTYWNQRGECPASHPEKLPQVQLHVVYTVPDGTSPGQHWRLSSDAYPQDQPGGFSAHGQYVTGWDPETANQWLSTCVNGSQDCGTAQPVTG